VIIKLDGNLNEDSRDIRAMLMKLNDVHNLQGDRKWQVRCGSCGYLGPWSAAILYATFLEGVRKGQGPRISLPDKPPELVQYCIFSGMTQAFKNGPAPTPDHPACETIPLERFEHASWDRSDGIMKLMRRHTSVDQEFEDQLRSCVQEIVQNIVDHARSPIGGVMSAKFFSSVSDVRVGIVDLGVGILNSLRAAHPQANLTAQSALRRVVAGNFTSQSRPNNMGLGISNLFSLIPACGGRIALISGSACAESHEPQRINFTDEQFDFPGTAVLFTLPTVQHRGE
jgi:hypothetical protein